MQIIAYLLCLRSLLCFFFIISIDNNVIYIFTQFNPEQIEAEAKLQWIGPDHVEVHDEIHEALSVHWHQVYDFSERCLPSCGVRESQRLEDTNLRLTIKRKVIGLTLRKMADINVERIRKPTVNIRWKYCDRTTVVKVTFTNKSTAYIYPTHASVSLPTNWIRSLENVTK
jgi:hypothetical protein